MKYSVEWIGETGAHQLETEIEDRALEKFAELASYRASDVALLRRDGELVQAYYSAAVHNLRTTGRV